jgi:hypothetical protein
MMDYEDFTLFVKYKFLTIAILAPNIVNSTALLNLRPINR